MMIKRFRHIKKRWLVGIPLAIALTLAYWQCLPEKLFNSPYSTVVLSDDGRLLSARIASDQQWRFPPTSSLPDKYKQSVLLFEDKRFYSHIGVDLIALSRAIIGNLLSGKRLSGASTISMQTMRLARGNPARTYWEKLKEMLLATRLEWSYSKDDILNLYASHAPFGGNIIGIEAASWRYFSRAPQQLSWSESALLAVLPNAPSLMHLEKNRSLLLAKRNRLLAKLHEQNIITELDLQLALAEPLPNGIRPIPQLAPHLVDSLTQQSNIQALHATIDYNMQQQISSITSQASQALQARHINNLAVLVIDNQDLSIKAYVGNSEYNTIQFSGYAMDLVKRPRSSGSILKPLLFASMLEQGELVPTTLIADLPTHFSGYTPENYDRKYRGVVPAKMALAQSLNIPAVRMLQQHGIHNFYYFLKNFGFSHLHRQPEEYGLPLILGGAEISLWDIAQAYANIAKISQHSGVTHYQPLTLISSEKSQRDSMSMKAASNKTSQNQLGQTELSQGAAWLTLEALVDVSRPGTDNHWRDFIGSQKIAWKTGTSYGLRDAWAIGVTAKWTVAVWAGNASGEGIEGLTGVSVAAPIMLDIFDYLPKSDWFPQPFHDMTQVNVCKENGYLAKEGCDSENIWINKTNQFAKLSPHHQQIFTDKNGQYRVHSGCEKVRNIKAQSLFVLPPAQEYYYKQAHSDYPSMPPFRADCLLEKAIAEAPPMDFIYPAKNSKIYIPRDINGSLSEVVFEAVHRKSGSAIHWHIDNKYMGSTSELHQMSFQLGPGSHRITLVDQSGFSVTRSVKVLGKQGS